MTKMISFILCWFFDCVQRLICSIKPSNSLNNKVFNLKTLLQTHGVVEVGLLEVILSNIASPLKQCHPELVTCTAFNISRDGDVTTFMGSLCQNLETLIIRKFFLMF